MKTILNSAEFIHIPEYSVYCYNFYRNTINGKIILQECDDDNEYQYYWVNEEDMINNKARANSEYIGTCYFNEFYIPTEIDRKHFPNEEYTFEFDSEIY